MWNYFDMVKTGGLKLARCKDKKCEGYLNPEMFSELIDNSTTNLWRHLKSHHPDMQR